VINLDRRPDRLQRFQKALERNETWLLSSQKLCRIRGRDGRHMQRGRQGLRGKVRSAHDPVPQLLPDAAALVADGWATPQAVATARQPHTRWPAMTGGGLGLYMAHADAWRQIIESGLDYGVIFEDDLTLFAPGFASQAAQILAGHEDKAFAFRVPWDLLYLQRCNDQSWLKPRVGDFWPVPDQPDEVRVDEMSIKPGETTTCTGAYIVSRRGAEILLQDGLPADVQVDQQISGLTNLKRAALTPPVAQCQEVVANEVGTYRDTDVHEQGDDLMPLPENIREDMKAHMLAAMRAGEAGAGSGKADAHFSSRIPQCHP